MHTEFNTQTMDIDINIGVSFLWHLFFCYKCSYCSLYTCFDLEIARGQWDECFISNTCLSSQGQVFRSKEKNQSSDTLLTFSGIIIVIIIIINIIIIITFIVIISIPSS